MSSRPSRWEHADLPANWDSIRRRILYRDPICTWREDGIQCQYLSTDVDHIVNRANGGGHEDTNLCGLCNYHHRLKTAQEGHAGKAAKRARLEAKYFGNREKHPSLIT